MMNMGRTRSRSSSSVYIVFCLQYLCVLGIFVLITHCDARKLSPISPRAPLHSETSSSSRETKAVKRFDVYLPLDSNSKSYGVSSPFNLPPYESLAPIPLPENSPPYCVYPPPSTTVPSPAGGGGGGGGGGGYIPPPPMPPSPPQNVPYFSPPQTVPSPTEPVLSPPWYYEPSPPTSIPSPTGYVPTPFLPPVVYPPPTVPPPPSTAPPTALWCVAKPAVPEPIIQEAMNYACASGAECDQIQPNGSCFQPDTLFAHASYAFNSYWQRTKQAGGTCEFGGTAMLVTVDPSYDGCHFTYV